MPRPSGIVHSPARASLSEDHPLTLSPRNRTSPLTGDSWPLATFSVVLLPAPFGPSSAYTCPGGMAKLTPCSTSIVP